ncbi:TetR/AcrR family transcriptional regulator [Phenylobacterium sp. LjRoot219]|uniref:TetR/AcrR family transcriptional regulator n=1 Tax=Phenylobacterium sp. LjRoot219 TaxID=3342283 RepID=UPI003ECCE165
MPTVDHDERRRRIAEVCVAVIAGEGLEAATIRRIAAEVGYSTTIVTHYFADKQELLLWAYRVLAEEAGARFEEVVARDPADLVGALLSMAAADELGLRRWRAYVAFWDRAARDAVFAAEQRLRIDAALARIAEVVLVRNGARADLERVSRLLNAVVQGISVQALVDPESWSRDQIESALAHQVATVLGPATS